MLPSFLYPSYKQYKTDSDAVATWLASTAQQCGYPKDLLVSQSSSQSAGRLKGKARKLAREATKSPKSGSEPAASPKHKIATKDFVLLAEWIVKSTKPRVEVPSKFVSILDRAIIVRQRHQSWWNAQDREDGDNESNTGHRFFIGILEKVRDVLRPCMPAEIKGHHEEFDKAASMPKSDDGHFLNLFENLKVEEPSEAFLNTEAASTKEAAETLSGRYGIDLDTDLDEVYFAVHCLFNDFDNLRRYLLVVWNGYKQGIFDLVASSIVTNTAIDFARRIHEDFVKTFPNHSDFQEHINVFYTSLCNRIGQSPSTKERPDDEMNFAVYNNAESFLFPAYTLVSSFSDFVDTETLPAFKPGYFGQYDPSSDRSSKSAREKFREDKIVLLEILPEFCVVALGSEIVDAEDEMMRGMRDMIQQKRVSMWFVFAAQVFLDVHHILRRDVSRGFDDLCRSARYVESNIKKVLEFHENLRFDNWPKENDRGLHNILELIERWTKTDVVAQASAHLMRHSRVPSDGVPEFHFLKEHPLHCGLLCYNIKTLAQEASLVFANASGSILCTAHLYNALRQERLLSSAWPDMDLALHLHRTEDMFVGDFPRTLDAYFKRFALAMGCPATSFAKGRGQTKTQASKAGPRILNALAPVSSMFMMRYRANGGRSNLTPDDVDEILREHAGTGEENLEESLDWTSPRIKINEPTSTGEAPESPKKGKSVASTGVRPIKLLNALLDALQQETLGLAFDHFLLHIACWEVLRMVKITLHDQLLALYGPGYLEKESQLPFVVAYIFMAATEASKVKGLMPKLTFSVTSRLLAGAGEVVREAMKTGMGDVERERMREWLGMEIEAPDLLEMVG